MKFFTKYNLFLGTATLILVLQMWLNSGNMSVYAATLANPHMMHGYITNYDDIHYEMNYKMLRGVKPKEEWKYGLTLRRVGLYIAGYPFFLLLGFYWGGEFTCFLLTIFTFLFLIHHIKKTYGMAAAYAGMLLAGSYTGIMYWIGSPFAQNTIFPICVFVYIIMTRLEAGIPLKKSIYLWLLIGFLFTGYDLFIMFIPAIFFFYIFRKEYSRAILSAFIMFLPQVLVELALQSYGALFHNNNKDLYKVIFSSYFNNFSLADLGRHIIALPDIFFENLFNTSFFILPSLFLLVYVFARSIYKFELNRIEVSIFLGILWLWLFLNLAPTYESYWQLRGVNIARIYQPVFIPMLMYLVRFTNYIIPLDQWKGRIYGMLLFFGFGICLWLNLGGWYGNKFTQSMYYNFYRHSESDAYFKNIEQYGKRPLGF